MRKVEPLDKGRTEFGDEGDAYMSEASLKKAGIFPTDTIFYHPQPLLIMEGNRRSLFPKEGKVNATCSLLEENYLARDLRRVVERSEKRTLQ